MKNWLRNRRITKCLIWKSASEKNPKLATLKISACLNMKRLIEEHNEALNDVKDNVTTENIEELDKLCHILEYKKGDAM